MSYQWIEIKPRPLKDGLHDSGYRFLRTAGASNNTEPVEMHEWADHIAFYGPVNIDVTRDGIFRVMGRGASEWQEPKHLYQSDGEFSPVDVAAAIKYVQDMNRIKGGAT